METGKLIEYLQFQIKIIHVLFIKNKYYFFIKRMRVEV